MHPRLDLHVDLQIEVEAQLQGFLLLTTTLGLLDLPGLRRLLSEGLLLGLLLELLLARVERGLRLRLALAAFIAAAGGRWLSLGLWLHLGFGRRGTAGGRRVRGRVWDGVVGHC